MVTAASAPTANVSDAMPTRELVQSAGGPWEGEEGVDGARGALRPKVVRRFTVEFKQLEFSRLACRAV